MNQLYTVSDDAEPVDDLSTLSWVHDELRKSLDAAHKSLRRGLKDADARAGSDVDAADPAVLRTARTQVHLGVSALEMIGLPGPARVLRASESALSRLIAKPRLLNAAAVETIESASFGVLDYLSRKLAGKGLPSLALFPQFKALQELAGADRVHPADLWREEWQWRDLAPDHGVAALQADASVRTAMETQVLAAMRGKDRGALQQLSDLCAGLGAASSGRLAGLWQLSAAFYEAQALGLLEADVYAKRVSSRLLAQLRMSIAGNTEVSDRLAQDVLFFCAHSRAPNDTHPAPRLSAVRDAFDIDAGATFDYSAVRLGRFDPALIQQARKRVGGAKEVWSAVAGGETHRLAGLSEQFALVGDSLRRLYPSGEALADALQGAVNHTLAGAAAPSPALAMEVATSVLYLDASLEDSEFDHPLIGERVKRLARRIQQVSEGREAQPLEPWMEELYRRVSERQTMGSVVQELRASLSEAEKHIDQYFRNPAERGVLIPVSGQLSAMRGVLSVLDMDQASQAVLRMRDDVDLLAATEVDPREPATQHTFNRLADNLGALSFMIDMLSVQPQMARSLFVFDPVAGNLSAVMGRRGQRLSAFGGFDELERGAPPALVEQAQTLASATANVSDESLQQDLQRLSQQALLADQRALAQTIGSAQVALQRATDDDQRQAVRADLAQAVAELADPGRLAEPEPTPTQQPVRHTPAPAPDVLGSTGLEDDPEMREIFVEEAREVVQDATAALQRLAADPEEVGDLTLIRRAFHTLKGSSRMVGLADFGEAAWACEQLYNTRLADQTRLDHELESFTADALRYLGAWVEAIAAGRQEGHEPTALMATANALRLGEAVVPPVQALAVEALHDLPTTADLSEVPVLPVAAPSESVRAAASAALLERVPELPSAEDLNLNFDLAIEDAPAAQVQAAALVAPAAQSAQSAGLEFELDLGDLDDKDAPGDAMPAPEFETAGSGAVRTVVLPVLPPLDSLPPDPANAQLLEHVSLDLQLPDDGPVATPLPPAVAADSPELASLVDLASLSVDDIDLTDRGSLLDEPSAEALPVVDKPAPVPEAPLGVGEVTASDWGAWDAATTDPGQLDSPPQASADTQPAGLVDGGFEASALTHTADAPPAAAAEAEAATASGGEDDQVKVIGDLRIGIPLFNIYLNEADELSRRLCTELSEWAMEPERGLEDSAAALAHSLAGSSSTVGYSDLSALSRALEHALLRSIAVGHASPGEAQLFNDAADEIRHLLHQFAAGFLKPVSAPLLQRLEQHERQLASAALDVPAEPMVADDAVDAAADDTADDGAPAHAEALPVHDPDSEAPLPSVATELGQLAMTSFRELPQAAAPVVHARADALDDEDDIDAMDMVDEELFPIFQEEGEELLPQLQQRMRDWSRRPAEGAAASACMRTLHTFKGGARLAGAMRLGEMAHRLETAIEHLLARGHAGAADVERLLGRVDAISSSFELLGRPVAMVAPAPAATPVPLPLEQVLAVEAHSAWTAAAGADARDGAEDADAEPSPEADHDTAPPPIAALTAVVADIDWSRFRAGPNAVLPVAERAASSMAAVRVRAPLLDRLVNQAGEVSITRARIETDVGQIKGSLVDLTDNLERLRRQLRDLELQAESQISSRMEAAKASAQGFDPLEMDRFTRFQELTRMMAESVNDVATVQRGLQRSLQATEDELAAQARLTRDLQDDLLRTRMVEFEGMADRLYRVVRQAAKETGKQVRLDIVGGAIEVDRGVLDRMTGPFEHLLRNCVAHGIESPEVRVRAGKDATGSIGISVTQEGNEVGVEFRDDGAGLNLARIRERALALGLLAADASASDAELAQMIFAPGFSTAESISELAGRGVGMDVVRAEVNAMGGRIETATAAGQGASFKLVLPLTTAVTQVVMLRCGELRIAVPSTLVEVVRRVPIDELEQAYASGSYMLADRVLPFFWLGALLQSGQRGSTAGRSQPVLVIRSASQRVALHVDEVLGNQEVVVKNLGPQLSRLPGLAGITLLPSGVVALIYNPVALATLYGDSARALSRHAPGVEEPVVPQVPEVLAPLVLVVDDSLTVRRVTQRLLVREGYRVTLAKDGLDALDKLSQELPSVVLSDIEMPRMDGFDLVRNMRSDERLSGLPVIMITSRIAQKHRDYAAELGVQHYLGKPYSEEELLSLVGQYTREAAVH
jgi:chemosensory pili system protein ChpA (sensor histidine kinase/response regulator)